MELPNVVYGSTVYFQDFENNGFITCKKRKNCMVVIEELQKKAAKCPPNIGDCCFEVIPKLAYSHVQRLAKREALYKNTPEEEWPDKIKDRIAKLRGLAEQEKTSNKALILKMKGALVTLGSTVLLYHPQTNCFLTLLKESADIDKNTLKLAVADDGSKGAWFDFMPAFKTSKLGDPIPFGQAVALRNTKNDVVVHVSNTIDTNMACSHPYIDKVHEVNCFVQQSTFGIFPFKPPADDSGHGLNLRSGNIVTLYHADTDAYLVCRDGR